MKIGRRIRPVIAKAKSLLDLEDLEMGIEILTLLRDILRKKIVFYKKIFLTLSFLPIFLKHVESFVKYIQIQIEMGNLVNFEDFSKYFLKFQSYLTQLLIRSLLYIFLDEFSFFRIFFRYIKLYLDI